MSDPQQLDDEDAFRLAYAQAAAHEAAKMLFERRVDALHLIPQYLVLPQHRRFIRHALALAPEMLSPAQREHADRLFWRYRRNMPAHLAPKVNPDDPIVREQRAKEIVRG
jgi:hypothetical protein